MVKYIRLNEARRVLRLSSEETLDLLEKGDIKGRPPRLLSASNGYDYCTGWLIERSSVEEYLAKHGRARRKPQTQPPAVPAGVLLSDNGNTEINTGF